MVSEEYSAVSRGGLRIKGTQGAKVDKHRKKKKHKSQPAQEDTKAEAAPTDIEQSSSVQTPKGADNEGSAEPQDQRDDGGEDADLDASTADLAEASTPSKTEAERQFEERRKRMLRERLKREGTKTHKERVEELNRYLSNLSEHHDMPRIGPG